MATLSQCNVFAGSWELERCPHCSVHKPNLSKAHEFVTVAEPQIYTVRNISAWANYFCATCGGVILVCRSASATAGGYDVSIGRPPTVYPERKVLSEDIPQRARNYLVQAINSISSPDAAVMVTASAIDAMLKEQGLVDGSLSSRIRQARESNLITQGMAEWAHEVRLAANEQRHSDLEVPHSTEQEARALVEFAQTLAEILFVLPARVQRGRTPINIEHVLKTSGIASGTTASTIIPPRPS